MNKLSILTVLSLVAFATTLDYDFTIGLSDQHFWSVNATVTLLVKNSRNPSETTTYQWRSNLIPNSNQTVNAGGIVAYKVEEFTKFMFKFEDSNNPQSTYSIKLRDFYLVPKYLGDSAAIAKQTIRICPPQKHQTIYSLSYVELKRYTC